MDWLTASNKSTGNSRSKCVILVFYHKLNMSIIAPLFQCIQFLRKLLGLFMNKSVHHIGNVTFKMCYFKNKYIHYICVGTLEWPLQMRYVWGCWLFLHRASILMW